jgi:hypothetical protein
MVFYFSLFTFHFSLKKNQPKLAGSFRGFQNLLGYGSKTGLYMDIGLAVKTCTGICS